jgi:flagellar hook-basal body complex protein FliE
MSIEKITLNPIRKAYDAQAGKMLGADSTDASFNDLLKGALQDLNQSQLAADAATKGFLSGEVTDVHKVMIALQKADINLRFALQVKNKLIQAYQQITTMQV